MLAWFTSDSDGWYTPEKTSRRTPAACAAATTPVTQRRRVGRKRRDDEEHAVDPIESSAHAGRVTQVAHRGLISPGIPVCPGDQR